VLLLLFSAEALYPSVVQPEAGEGGIKQATGLQRQSELAREGAWTQRYQQSGVASAFFTVLCCHLMASCKSAEMKFKKACSLRKMSYISLDLLLALKKSFSAQSLFMPC